MHQHSRGMICPRFAKTSSPTEGAGNAGCALHPRSRVQIVRNMRTRAYRFSGNTPASPAQWLYGLWRALLGDEFLFVTVIDGLKVLRDPIGPAKPPPIWHQQRMPEPHAFAVRSPASPSAAPGVYSPTKSHTKPALAPFVCTPHIAHGNPPCNRLARRHCRVHRISTHV